jgi:hypothetical protein
MQMSSLTYLLDDSDIIDDLKIINKNKAFSVNSLYILVNKIPLYKRSYFYRCINLAHKVVPVQPEVPHQIRITETHELKRVNCSMRSVGFDVVNLFKLNQRMETNFQP